VRRIDPVVGAAVVLVVVATVVLDQWLARAEYVFPGGGARIVRGAVVRRDPPIEAWGASGARRTGETVQRLDVRTATGTVVAENIVTGSPVSDRIPDVGEEVLVRIRDLGRERYATMRDHARDRWLVRLAGALGLLVVVVLGRKGARALAALVVGLGIVLAFSWAVMTIQGAVMPLTLAALGATLAATYLILCGATRKALSAAGGAFAGIVLSGVLALLVARVSGLSGLYDQDLAAVRHFSTARVLDFRALLVASMLLGTMGVVMDVAIAVASAVGELARANPALDARSLRRRGMAVGRKVMGAMVMALALAYMGINFGLFLLPHADPALRFADVVGTERVLTEICRLLVGVTAIVWAVPATAFLASCLAAGRVAKGAV